MDTVEHYIQDAFELRAVGLMQALAEQRSVARTHDSAEKLAAFDSYLARRGASRPELSETHAAYYDTYGANLDLHLPRFIDRLIKLFPGEMFNFVNVEAEARNAGRKEDFLIERSSPDPVRVSLKNYRRDARRPQVCSGTYNSFIVNFLLESAGGPGRVRHPVSGEDFQGSDKTRRDDAISSLGLGAIMPLLAQMDALNDEIKETFVRGDEFAYYDGDRFDAARKDCGNRGADLAVAILKLMGDERVRSRTLTLAGLDDGDELLLMDPSRCTDSLTSARFRAIRLGANDAAATVRYDRRGQSIIFTIVGPDGEDLLPAAVPFTINKNGAWHLPTSGPYEGTELKRDKGHDLQLHYGERRPYKSRELATSVNTYVQFEAAGIFDLDEV